MGKRVKATKYIKAEDFWFKGHFPNYPVPFVYAAEESIASSELSNDIQISKPEYAAGNMEADGLLEPVTEDDPEYHKYLENNDPYGIMTMSALWGADSLTHQNRFNGVSKVYGIDVSYYQGNIDWKKVKNSGVEFVIITWFWRKGQEQGGR